jgi:hypothetical protein
MNMKNLNAKFSVAVVLFAMSAGLLRAQNSTNENDTNTAMAQVAPSTPTNTAVAKQSQSSDNGAVRIDNNGIHVGAANGQPPVDIHWGNSFPWNSRNGGLVALVSVAAPFIFAFSLPVVIIAIVFVSRHRRNKMVHETVRAMIDKGMPVTPEVLAGLGGKHTYGGYPPGKPGAGNPADQAFPPRQRSRNRHLLPALILIGVGLALTGMHPWHAGTGGQIVLFIGVAFLIVWLVDKNQDRNYERNVNTERKQDNDQPPKI